MTAQNAMWFALAIIVEEATRSTMHLSFAILTSILPAVLLGMVAGAMVDRMNKKSVLVATNLLRAVAVLGYLLYDRALIFVYLVNLVFVSIGQFFGPAEYATIPSIVPRKQLVAANSLFNLTFNGSQLVGIVLVAPFVLKFFGPEVLFISETAVYLVATVLVALLPPGDVPAKSPPSLFGGRMARQIGQEITDAWQFMRSDRQIWLAIVHLTTVGTMILIVAMLGPRFTVAVLGIRADDAVYMLAPAVVGILVGTTIMSTLVNRLGKERVVNIGLVVLGAGLFFLSTIHWMGQNMPAGVPASLGIMQLHRAVGLVPGVMALTALLGLCTAMAMIPAQTVIMERTHPQNRGRLFAVQILFGNLAAIVPLLFLGSLADLISVEAVMGILALLVLVAAAYSIGQTRRLHATAWSGDPQVEPDPGDESAPH
jgi:MFS family permease